MNIERGILERFARRQAIAGRGNALGLATMLRRTRPVWANERGVYVLLRWDGERDPAASIEPWAARPGWLVGLAFGDETSVATFASVTHAADTIYHHALVALSGGGADGALAPLGVASSVFSGGAKLGARPNTPSAVQVSLLPDNRPLVTWVYSEMDQEAAPTAFQVFASSGAAFNFASPAGSVAAAAGTSRYHWIGSALSVGDVRWYTVRAVSGAGVLSMIPRWGRAPSPDYDAVELERCPILPVPAVNNAPPMELLTEVTS